MATGYSSSDLHIKASKTMISNCQHFYFILLQKGCKPAKGTLMFQQIYGGGLFFRETYIKIIKVS